MYGGLKWSVLPPPVDSRVYMGGREGGRGEIIITPLHLFHRSKNQPTNHQLINYRCGIGINIKFLSSLKIPQAMNNIEQILLFYH